MGPSKYKEFLAKAKLAEVNDEKYMDGDIRIQSYGYKL
jgi:hypothetical protein